jgi:hypothetical protein
MPKGLGRLPSAFNSGQLMLVERKKQIAALAALAVFACGEPMAGTRGVTAPSSPTKHVMVGSVVTDNAMGNLSLVARQIVVGLGDPAVRQRVVEAMKDPGTAGAGLDLSACESGSIAADLLSAGEERGAANGAALCSSIRRSGPLTLYMSRDGLRRWDGSFVPIVTAIEDSDRKPPKQWKGYRSGQRTIDLFADGPTPGPVLVVLRVAHPSRLVNASRTMPTQQTYIVPLAPAVSTGKTASAAQKRRAK